MHGNLAYGGPPPVHVPLLLLDALGLVPFEVGILDLRLPLPVLLEMHLAQILHLLLVLTLLLQVVVVHLATHHGLVPEGC